MRLESLESISTTCQSEYGTLRKVIVCEPQYMTIDEIINDCQLKYKDENIKTELAMKQHHNFVQTMRSNGVEVITIPSHEEFPEQVFTRDIGFTLGKQTFVSEMASKIRKGEEKVLEKWLSSNQIPHHNISRHPIEGGDVIIDGSTVYVGLSNRTCKESLVQLKHLLPSHKVIPVPFNPKYLHLDCVFNVLSSTDALIFPAALSPRTVDSLAKRYNLIEVTKEEQFTMGTNVLSIGNKKVFSQPLNKQVNAKMRAHGYEILEVDFSEIIKSGGAFRCCTMPLERR
jgi:N-dimethylarginine dimethylaminohydrolase